jgi:Mrp family chromosome partitioning ATPase
VILSAHKAKERLDMVKGNLMGVIVNGMDQNLYYNEYGTYYRGAYYGSNYYGYRYSRYYAREYSNYSDAVGKQTSSRKSSKA